MILPWFVAWLLWHTPHIVILPVGHMNTWGLLLVLAVLAA